MKTRLLITGVVILGCLMLNFYLHQAFAPRTATNLALNQLNEDGSREALRAMERISNWIEVSTWGMGVAGIGVIWWPWLLEGLRSKRRTRLRKYGR